MTETASKQEEIVVEIFGTPPTVNRIWRTSQGRTYLSGEAKAFIGLVALGAAGKKAPKTWKYCDVSIVVFPRDRRGDVDNRIKAVLDGLTKCGFWEDDACVARVSCQFGEQDDMGRTRVTIREATSKYPFAGGGASSR